ncbi:hypothetical protein D3C85_1146070 [compost metagenome]
MRVRQEFLRSLDSLIPALLALTLEEFRCIINDKSRERLEILDSHLTIDRRQHLQQTIDNTHIASLNTVFQHSARQATQLTLGGGFRNAQSLDRDSELRQECFTIEHYVLL